MKESRTRQVSILDLTWRIHWRTIRTYYTAQIAHAGLFPCFMFLSIHSAPRRAAQIEYTRNDAIKSDKANVRPAIQISVQSARN